MPPFSCRAPASPTQIDVRGLGCVELARELARAYYKVLAGQGRVTVRFQEQWTEYQKGNVDGLLTAYCQIYNQCPDAVAAGLPNLNPGNMVKRGRPARGLQFFPRL